MNNAAPNAAKKPRGKLLLYNIILTVCIMVFLGSAGYLGYYYWQAYKAENEYDTLRPDITLLDPDALPDGEGGLVYSTVSIDWAPLLESNSEVVGYIIVPNTRVDYPVVKGPDNEKYLDTTVLGTYNPAGAIFMSYENHEDMGDYNTVIYGHNRNNGSMFEDLTRFLEPEFFAENRTISYFNPEGEYTYEIVAAYVTTIEVDYARVIFATQNEFAQYLDMIKQLPDINAAPGFPGLSQQDHLLTLSTCTNRAKDTRVVIQAKLVDFKPAPR